MYRISSILCMLVFTYITILLRTPHKPPSSEYVNLKISTRTIDAALDSQLESLVDYYRFALIQKGNVPTSPCIQLNVRHLNDASNSSSLAIRFLCIRKGINKYQPHMENEALNVEVHRFVNKYEKSHVKYSVDIDPSTLELPWHSLVNIHSLGGHQISFNGYVGLLCYFASNFKFGMSTWDNYIRVNTRSDSNEHDNNNPSSIHIHLLNYLL